MEISNSNTANPLSGALGILMTMIYGADTLKGGRIVMDSEGLEAMVTRLQEMRRTATKILDKGGIAVVEADGVVVTAYNLN